MKEWTKTPLRTAALVLGVVAAVAMFYLYNPWANPTGTVQNLTTWVVLDHVHRAGRRAVPRSQGRPESDTVEIEGPAFARFLLSNSRAGLVWLPIRIFVGFEWLEAGWHKLTGTGWVDGGASLLGFWNNAVKIPATGNPSITFEWYRGFLQTLIDNHAQGWFAWLITFGEMAVGLGLLFGVLTGIRRLLRGPDEHVVPARRLGLGRTRCCSPWRSASSSPGRSPATTASTATSCRRSARHGSRAR